MTSVLHDVHRDVTDDVEGPLLDVDFDVNRDVILLLPFIVLLHVDGHLDVHVCIPVVDDCPLTYLFASLMSCDSLPLRLLWRSWPLSELMALG